jgi:hypothetical protein
MSSFLAALLALLVPILAILIVRVRTRQRLPFPHTYLRSLRERPFQEFLLRTFQLYADVAFDLLLAILLALVLSGVLDLSPRRTAVCLDGSWSMARGAPDSPLERGLAKLARGELGAERYRLFVLGFDPRRGGPTLIDMGRGGKDDLPRLRARVRKSVPRFFSADPRALGRLFRRGYRRVLFLTDRPPQSAPSLEVVDLGETREPFFYPYSAGFDTREQAFRVRFWRYRFDLPVGIMKYSEEEGSFRKLSIEQQGVPGSPLSELLLREPGLYRFYAEVGPLDLDFLIPLVPPALEVSPRGPYSELLAGLLPEARRSPRGILLADVPWRSADRRFPRGSARGLHGMLTVVPDPGVQPALRPYLQPLVEAFCLPCYTEVPAELLRVGGPHDRVFYFDPRGVRDERTALVYLSALSGLAAGGPDGPAGQLPRGARYSPGRSSSSAYAYTTSSGIEVLNLPPEEFFPFPIDEDLTLPPPASAPLPIALLLLLPYALKALVLDRLHRRGR